VPLLHSAAPQSAAGAPWPSPRRAARTAWRVLERGAGCARVALWPASGRTHQLRLHCAAGLGAPVVGDALYGSPDLAAAPFAAELAARGGGGAEAAAVVAEAAALAALAAAAAVRRPALPSCPLLPAHGAGPVPRLLLHAAAVALFDDMAPLGAAAACGYAARWGAADAALMSGGAPGDPPPRRLVAAAAARRGAGGGGAAAAADDARAALRWAGGGAGEAAAAAAAECEGGGLRVYEELAEDARGRPRRRVTFESPAPF